MGGQAFRKGGVVLDMRGFNRIVLNESTRSVTVQPGATWHDIQNVLHPRFAENGFIYFTYSKGGEKGLIATALARCSSTTLHTDRPARTCR